MKLSLSLLMLMISLIMLFLNHPLSMGLTILIQTMLMCLLSGMMIKTYWFSYILFLTLLGGLLVMFIYVSSIASNELFNLSLKMKMIMIVFILIMLLNMMFIYLFKFSDKNWMNFSNNLSENDNFLFIEFFNNENKINLNKLYNNHNYMLMMMLVIYLFISLVAIVKITNIKYGPLRSM